MEGVHGFRLIGDTEPGSLPASSSAIIPASSDTKIHRKHMGVHESTVQEAAHRPAAPAAPSPAPAPAPTSPHVPRPTIGDAIHRDDSTSQQTHLPACLPTYLPTTTRRLASLFLTEGQSYS